MSHRVIKFHFYTAENFGAWLIKARLSTAFSHCGAEFEDGLVYHSTMAYGNHRSNPTKLQKPAVTIELKIDNDAYARALAFAKTCLGKKYDFRAIWGFVIGKKVQDDNNLFCSEHCIRIFEEATGVRLKYYTLVCPETMYNVLSTYVYK